MKVFGANHNIIGGNTPAHRNVISGNDRMGIAFDTNGPQQSDYNRVEGNYIGTDATGNIAIPNSWDGIDAGRSIGGIIINNVISGNTGDGLN